MVLNDDLLLASARAKGKVQDIAELPIAVLIFAGCLAGILGPNFLDLLLASPLAAEQVLEITGFLGLAVLLGASVFAGSKILGL